MTTIIYPYNEILPLRTAHDTYIVQQCAAMAAAGITTTLVCGAGSLPDAELYDHYGITPSPNLTIVRLPILRKQYVIRATCSLIFYYFCARYIKHHRPDVVLASDARLLHFLLQRRQPTIRYHFDVHCLPWYPGGVEVSPPRRLQQEIHTLQHADRIAVTTAALADILRQAPYDLTTDIDVIPLASHATQLPAIPPPGDIFQLYYVGQLYRSQRVDELIRALVLAPTNVHLTIIGGKSHEVSALQELGSRLGVAKRLHLRGFQPPAQLSTLVASAHAFVAPFGAEGRHPYVAHTKMMEYANWGRPFIVPDLPVAREHFSADTGVEFFTADDVPSLADSIRRLCDPVVWAARYRAASKPDRRLFSWAARGQQLRHHLMATSHSVA